MLGNSGLLAISFFESTAFIVLSVLFILLRRDHPASYFRLWLSGWILLTLSSVAEIGLTLTDIPQLRLVAIAAHVGRPPGLPFLGNAVRGRRDQAKMADRPSGELPSRWRFAGSSGFPPVSLAASAGRPRSSNRSFAFGRAGCSGVLRHPIVVTASASWPAASSFAR